MFAVPYWKKKLYFWDVERLSVITVPATDLDGNYHTAFTVFDDFSEDLRSSAGWTLRDAIEFYARKYGVEKGAIKLIRPFVPQEKHLRERGERVWGYGVGATDDLRSKSPHHLMGRVLCPHNTLCCSVWSRTENLRIFNSKYTICRWLLQGSYFICRKSNRRQRIQS